MNPRMEWAMRRDRDGFEWRKVLGIILTLRYPRQAAVLRAAGWLLARIGKEEPDTPGPGRLVGVGLIAAAITLPIGFLLASHRR